MGFSFDINKVFTGSNAKVDIQPTGAQKAERTETPVTDNKVIGEYGDKLLEQVRPTFVTAAQIPAEDAVELNEMFAMAGMRNPKMPTVAQYESISGAVTAIAGGIEELGTRGNVQSLYSSPQFKTLDNFFGIT